MKRGFLLIIYIVWALLLQAEEADSLRFALKAKTYSAGMGLYQLSDPYLSPIPYSGEGFRFLATERSIINPEKPQLSATHRSYAEFALPTHVYGFNNMWMLNANYVYAMQRHFRPRKNTLLLVGGSGELDLGAKFISRNVNNPFSLDLYARINASSEIQHRFYLKNRMFRLQYGAELPVAGVQFAPNASLSYHEISLTQNLGESLHFTSWHNSRVFYHYLNFDIPLYNDAIRLSFAQDYALLGLNQMVYKRNAILFSLGYVMQIYRFKTRKDKIPSNFINVYE